MHFEQFLATFGNPSKRGKGPNVTSEILQQEQNPRTKTCGNPSKRDFSNLVQFAASQAPKHKDYSV
jgi:hypothetical protein